jgi:hypothetical protein
MNPKIKIVEVPINELCASEYNSRKHSQDQMDQLKQSIKRFGLVDPAICNSATERKNVIIGGHFRVAAAKELGLASVPVVYVKISDLDKEKELNLRLNKNVGEFDWDLLANFDESFLQSVGFSSEELDDVFGIDEAPEVFDLKKELAKLNIKKIKVKNGEVYDLNGSRLMIGNSMVEADVLKLMGGQKADMVFTDPPYLLDYLKGKKKKNGNVTKGFGLKPFGASSRSIGSIATRLFGTFQIGCRDSAQNINFLTSMILQ